MAAYGGSENTITIAEHKKTEQQAKLAKTVWRAHHSELGHTRKKNSTQST